MDKSTEHHLVGKGTTYTHTQTWGDADRQETWYWKWDPERKVAIVTRNDAAFATLMSGEHLEQLDLPEEMRFLLTLYMKRRTS